MSKHRKIKKVRPNRCIICKAIADWPLNGKYAGYKPLCTWCAENVSGVIVEVASGTRKTVDCYTINNWMLHPTVLDARARRKKCPSTSEA